MSTVAIGFSFSEILVLNCGMIITACGRGSTSGTDAAHAGWCPDASLGLQAVWFHQFRTLL